MLPLGHPSPDCSLVPQLSPCPKHHPVTSGRETNPFPSQNLPQPPPPPLRSRGRSAPGPAQPPDRWLPPRSPFPWPGACRATRLPAPQKHPPCPRPFPPLPQYVPPARPESPGAAWRPKPHKSQPCRSVAGNILCKKVFPGSTEGWRILLRGTLLIIRSQPNLLQQFFMPGPKPDYFPPSADLPLLEKKREKGQGKKKKCSIVCPAALGKKFVPRTEAALPGLGGAGSSQWSSPSMVPQGLLLGVAWGA